jgi:hypothetical protein
VKTAAIYVRVSTADQTWNRSFTIFANSRRGEAFALYTVDTMTRCVQAARKRAKVRPNGHFRQNTIIRASNLSVTEQAYRARSR